MSSYSMPSACAISPPALNQRQRPAQVGMEDIGVGVLTRARQPDAGLFQRAQSARQIDHLKHRNGFHRPARGTPGDGIPTLRLQASATMRRR